MNSRSDRVASQPPSANARRGKGDPAAQARTARGPSPSREERRRAHSIKTDIEQLLPISQAVKSLPRPPRLPSFDLPAAPAARRVPWASLAVFAMVILASAPPLLSYLGTRRSTAPQLETAREPQRHAPNAGAELDLAAEPGAGAGTGRSDARRVAEREERAAPGAALAPTSAHALDAPSPPEALLAQGRSALEAGDEREAERLFARAYELARDDARAAAGLARVRLAQGDLEGAEGWVLAALRKRPREPNYRALYADVLARQGRRAEARLERSLARSLILPARPASDSDPKR